MRFHHHHSKSYFSMDIIRYPYVALVTAAVAALGLLTEPVQAKPYCASLVTGGWAKAATPPEAEEKAITWWSSRAGALGKGFHRWSHATSKSMKCEKLPDGQTRCRAQARPCLDEGQVPPSDGVPEIKL